MTQAFYRPTTFHSDFASVHPNAHPLHFYYQILGVIIILCVLVTQTPIWFWSFITGFPYWLSVHCLTPSYPLFDHSTTHKQVQHHYLLPLQCRDPILCFLLFRPIDCQIPYSLLEFVFTINAFGQSGFSNGIFCVKILVTIFMILNSQIFLRGTGC